VGVAFDFGFQILDGGPRIAAINPKSETFDLKSEVVY
jgi:hypothetical protein